MSPNAQTSNRGWIVALAGTGINLALGILYSWSIISKNIPADWNWSETQKALPYTIACLVFAFMMVPAGKLQDRFGPRLVASIGGILVGAGLIMAGQFTTVGYFIIGFGVLAGTGIGFGYASATPPAMKWFPPAKTGMIAGIVVAGFGLASVYIAPLSQFLIGKYGIQQTMFIFGIAFCIVVVLLSQLLKNPPPKADPVPTANNNTPAIKVVRNDFLVKEVLASYQFYILWLMYAFNAGAGLMVIGKLAFMGTSLGGEEMKLVWSGLVTSLGLSDIWLKLGAGFILVALLAVGNAGGRILAGMLSDKLGRIRTLQIFTLFQAIIMFTTPSISNWIVIVFFSVFIGMNYGSNLSVFPSITKDFFGLKNFGVNYGLVFTAWGVGSLLALVSGIVYDRTGSFQLAFFLAGALLIVSIILSFTVKKPKLTEA